MARCFYLLAALAPVALAACQPDSPASAPVSSAPPARITGAPVDCVQLSQIGESHIRDDQTIDFISFGRKGWRNTLPQSCPGLKFADAFSHETSINQICNVDIITVLEQGGGVHRGASCGLGQFVPIELAK
jgi:hypothetical protein